MIEHMFALRVSRPPGARRQQVVTLAGVDARLLPLNAFIGLCTPDHLWPSPLAELGYTIRGLEIPVTVGDGRVVVDAVAFRETTRSFMAAEAKSGRNVNVDQAQAYGGIQPADLVRGSRVTDTSAGQ